MRALCWMGVNELSVETVEDPRILNDHDVILKVRLSTTCGSDLHLLGGYIPMMRAGDVLGHEFMGEIAEVGPAVRKHRVGDRVVVCSFISCGQCWYCSQQLYSLCDNGNPNPAITETMWGSGDRRGLRLQPCPGRVRRQPRRVRPGPVRRPGRVSRSGRGVRPRGAVRLGCRADRLDGRRPRRHRAR